MVDGLSQQEREMIAQAILEGKRVATRYAPSIIDGANDLELVWAGKSALTEQFVLPFQSIEQIDEPRQDTSGAESLLDFLDADGRQIGGWSNKLIWGDNKFVIASLSRGPLRREIEKAGGLKLVYIDPPFDVGYDFSLEVEVGEETLSKQPTVLEQIAYRDTWGKGAESFVNLIYQRLRLIHDLLSEDGSIFLHCDSRTRHLTRLALDEVFGSSNFRSEIVWKKTNSPKSQAGGLGAQYDTIIWYSKSSTFYFKQPYRNFDEKALKAYSLIDENGDRFQTTSLVAAGSQLSSGRKQFEFRGVTAPWLYKIETLEEMDRQGLIYQTKNEGLRKKLFLKDMEGVLVSDIWVDEDVPPFQGKSSENVDYPTQKPESLLRRIIEMASRPGDLVADFFVGSGTTLAVAEKLERKWIGADLGRFAIHTSRKRLISVQRERKSRGLSYRSFEILNLGKYERQRYLAIDDSEDSSSESLRAEKRDAFVDLVLEAYAAQKASQLSPFVGLKQQAAVFIGEVDFAVTEEDVDRCISAALDMGITKIDILGFEFEMGITPRLPDKAKEQGLTLTLRYIPSEVFDSRAVKSASVEFFEVGYVEVQPEVEGLSVRIKLSDFGVFYRQSDAQHIEESLKSGGKKIIIDQGQVFRIEKDKSGILSRKQLTTKWEDWIDYWSIDFNFESKPEVLRFIENNQEIEKRSGRFIFENEWQSFRTSRERGLELVSSWHVYPGPGDYKIAIKVIDIFGNDTTRVIRVKLG